MNKWTPAWSWSDPQPCQALLPLQTYTFITAISVLSAVPVPENKHDMTIYIKHIYAKLGDVFGMFVESIKTPAYMV